MLPTFNLCTAVLPGFDFDQMAAVVKTAQFKTIELRVHEYGHKSLDELEHQGLDVIRKLEKDEIEVQVLNSYLPIEENAKVDRMLNVCHNMGVPRVRLVLPRSCKASVSRQANIRELLPSYEPRKQPAELMVSLRSCLKDIERKARLRNLQVLLELHWGTVMSSFSSAYFLLADLDPRYIALTFDPANMVVEGKEDWEFGIKLVQDHISNVHVKNTSWILKDESWQWGWSGIDKGMVDWRQLLNLLYMNGYDGAYALEDFLVPQTGIDTAAAHLMRQRELFMKMFPASDQKAA